MRCRHRRAPCSRPGTRRQRRQRRRSDHGHAATRGDRSDTSPNGSATRARVHYVTVPTLRYRVLESRATLLGSLKVENPQQRRPPTGRRSTPNNVDPTRLNHPGRSPATGRPQPPAANPSQNRRLRLLELRANPVDEARNSSEQAVADQRPHPADLLALPAFARSPVAVSFSRCDAICSHSSGRPSFVNAEQVSTGGVQLGDAGVIRWIARR